MTKFITVVLGIIVLLFLVVSFSSNESSLSRQQDNSQLSTVSIGESTVVVDIADTFLTRRTGLSGRESILPNHGMLFIFDETDFHGIWMKEMLFPIDIVWIGSNISGDSALVEQSELFYVIDIKKDAQPDSYPEIFYPNGETKFVLEVSSGFTENHNIKIGDEVHF